MNARATVPKKRVCIYRLLVDLTKEDAQIGDPIEDEVPESRATRLVGDSRRFMIVSFARKSREDYIRRWLENLIMPKMSTRLSIDLGDERFFFLGYTENHLKSGNLLFFREGPDFTVDDLKDHFGGDLRSVYEIYGYGKYAARLGLSFSSTAATKEIEPEERELLDDLEAADGSLTSDGCGMIRESYAQEIASILQVPPDTAVYQVRLGGIKGVLALCPDEKFDLLCSPGKKIAYRRSMVKYNEGPHVLEVQNISKSPKRGRLNKQFIVLLLTLGVPLSVFEDLLNIQLEQIASIVTNREKALACVDGDVDAEGNGFYQELYEMLLAGHDMSEPYLACLLRRFQRTTLNALREKLQIPVDGSGNIYGVVDCHEVLEEGEVYINLPGRGGPQVGPVVVTRNPAYDPNGIRVLDAVNRPELKHLTNCIVFSAKGAHSEPDRMAGGDLDGDLYFFVFNPALIPKRQATAAPVTVKKLTLRTKTVKIAGRVQGTSRRVPRGDMNKDAIDTFLGLRCNFLLGGLANEWMARVGTTPDLANSAACKTLLPMIEIALDIVKSGESVKKLRYEFEQFKAANPGPRPKRGWTDPLVHLARLVPASPKEEMTFTCDPQLILRDEAPDDFDKMADDAKQAMRAFNRLLQSAISADAEAKAEGWEEDEKRADLVKATMIAQHFPPVENVLHDVRKNLLKASVWYFTGYKYKKQAFAWLGARWLNYLKSLQSGRVPVAVGVRSAPLIRASSPPPPLPSTPKKARTTSRAPATPVSPVRPPRVCGPQPLAFVPPALRSSDSGSDSSESTESESDSSFDLIDRDSVYDTAVEELLPATIALYITASRSPQSIVRTNSEDTLVDNDDSDAPDMTPKARDRRARARTPARPPSPVSDLVEQRRTRAQTRAAVTGEASRPRTRAQRRLVPVAAATPQKHEHTFLVRPGGYECACGKLVIGAVNSFLH